MTYVIRSEDRRLAICTASAGTAVGHAVRLRRKGRAVEVRDGNGNVLNIATLLGQARLEG